MLTAFKRSKFFQVIRQYRIYKILKITITLPLLALYRYIQLKKIYPSIYKKNAQKPINENKIVFIEVTASTISDSAQLLYDALSKKNYDIHVHCLLSTTLNHKQYKIVKNMIKDIADAKYIFITDTCTIISNLPLRKETIFTQLWHACGAFKKFGFSSIGTSWYPKGKYIEKYPPHKNYTYVTVSSNEVIWAYEEAMKLEKGIVQATGCSRTDIFFDSSFKEKAYQKLYEIIPNAKGKKVILYAPTFRGISNQFAEAPNMLNIPLFQETLSNEYILIIKHHPFCHSLPKIPEESKNFAIDCTNTMTIEDLLYVSDLCISDYSSLIFEYSLFERPMIFFAYDLDSYYDQRGFFYDYKDFVPGPIFATNEEIIEYIQNIDAQFNKSKVIDFKNKFMSACDGHATERILNLVFQENF